MMLHNLAAHIAGAPRGRAVVTPLAALALVLAAASCSQIVDSGTSPTKPAENNVRNYYIKLPQTGMQYRYEFASNHIYQPAKDTLMMDMKGLDDAQYNSMDVWKCDWSYAVAGAGRPWYYALADTEAVALGVEIANKYTDSWVELKAPLSATAHWTFTSQGEVVTAQVEKYGVTATVCGHTYDDVIEVRYTGANGTTGVTWFARNTGTIFSHIERPGNAMLDMKFESMRQN